MRALDVCLLRVAGHHREFMKTVICDGLFLAIRRRGDLGCITRLRVNVCERDKRKMRKRLKKSYLCGDCLVFMKIHTK